MEESNTQNEHTFCDEHVQEIVNNLNVTPFKGRNPNSIELSKYFMRSKLLDKSPKPEICHLKKYTKDIKIDTDKNDIPNVKFKFWSFGLSIFNKEKNTAEKIIQKIEEYIANNRADICEGGNSETKSWCEHHKLDFLDVDGESVPVVFLFLKKGSNNEASKGHLLCVVTSISFSQYNFQVFATNSKLISSEQDAKEKFMKENYGGFWGFMPLCSFHTSGGDLFFHGVQWEDLEKIKNDESQKTTYESVFQSICQNNSTFYFPVMHILASQPRNGQENGPPTCFFKAQNCKALSQALNVCNITNGEQDFTVYGLSAHMIFFRNYLYLRRQMETTKSLLGSWKYGISVFRSEIKCNFWSPSNKDEHEKHIEKFNTLNFENNHMLNRKAVSDDCNFYYSSVLEKRFTWCVSDGFKTQYTEEERKNNPTLQYDMSVLKQLLDGKKLHGMESIGFYLNTAANAEKLRNDKDYEEKLAYATVWNNLIDYAHNNEIERNDPRKSQLLRMLIRNNNLPQTNRFLRFEASKARLYQVKSPEAQEREGYLFLVTLPFTTPYSFNGSCSSSWTGYNPKYPRDNNSKPYFQYHAAAEFGPIIDKFNDIWSDRNGKSFKLFYFPPSFEPDKVEQYDMKTHFASITYYSGVSFKADDNSESQYKNYFWGMQPGWETTDVRSNFEGYFCCNANYTCGGILPDFLRMHDLEWSSGDSGELINNSNTFPTEFSVMDEMKMTNGFIIYRLLVPCFKKVVDNSLGLVMERRFGLRVTFLIASKYMCTSRVDPKTGFPESRKAFSTKNRFI